MREMRRRSSHKVRALATTSIPGSSSTESGETKSSNGPWSMSSFCVLVAYCPTRFSFLKFTSLLFHNTDAYKNFSVQPQPAFGRIRNAHGSRDVHLRTRHEYRVIPSLVLQSGADIPG